MKKKFFYMSFKQRFFFFFLFILLCTFPSNGQEKKETGVLQWEFSIGGNSYYVSSANYWNFGPELTVQYAFSNTHGIYFSTIYPTVMMTSRGYGFREGFAFDLGGWLSPRRFRSWLKFGVGLSYIFGSDADGSQIRMGGVHIGSQASYWFKRKVGLWVRGVLRFWKKDRHNDDYFSPSFSAGIGFRF